jgi:hypothetical protein
MLANRLVLKFDEITFSYSCIHNLPFSVAKQFPGLASLSQPMALRQLYIKIRKNILKRKWWWMEELRQERERDIKIEMSKESKATSFYSHNCYCSLPSSQSFTLSNGISTNHHKKHCI